MEAFVPVEKHRWNDFFQFIRHNLIEIGAWSFRRCIEYTVSLATLLYVYCPVDSLTANRILASRQRHSQRQPHHAAGMNVMISSRRPSPE
jgi:hypothetical protein